MAWGLLDLSYLVLSILERFHTQNVDQLGKGGMHYSASLFAVLVQATPRFPLAAPCDWAEEANLAATFAVLGKWHLD